MPDKVLVGWRRVPRPHHGLGWKFQKHGARAAPFALDHFGGFVDRQQQQSSGSQTGIVLLISVIPGVIALLAAFVMRYYSLDNQQLAKIQFDLQQRKAAAAPL